MSFQNPSFFFLQNVPETFPKSGFRSFPWKISIDTLMQETRVIVREAPQLTSFLLRGETGTCDLDFYIFSKGHQCNIKLTNLKFPLASSIWYVWQWEGDNIQSFPLI